MRDMIKIKCWSLLALPALLASCSSDDFRGSDSEGSIRLQLAVDTQPVGSSSSRAELNDLTIDDLKIRLKAADGKVREWNSKAEFEKEEKFAIGDYTLEAYYGQETDCGFEKPYVYGSTGITVHHGETTTATIEAALANSMVTVTYSENVSKFFTDYSVTLTGDNGPGVEYPVDVRPVYITPGKVQILFNYTDGAGETIVGHVTDFTAEPAHHYRINIDINGGEIGDAVMKVSFDDTMEQHTEEIKLEDLTAPGAPVMSGTGFTDGTAVPVVAGVSRADDLYCGVIARGGLKSLKLTTAGASKISASWPADIELVGASEAQQNTLKNLGLTIRGLYGNGSGEDEKTDLVVVDFRNVIAKLPDATEGDITFTLAAVDKYDQAPAAPISLALSVTPFKMDLSDALAEVWEGDEAFSMKLTYNGGDPDANLQIRKTNERGTDDPVTATFTPTGNEYEYTVNITTTCGEALTIFAKEKQGTRKTDAKTITCVKIPTVTVLDADVWATKAYVTIQDAQDNTKYYGTESLLCSTDGVSFNKTLTPVGSGNLMLIEGLTPGTEYTLTARNPKDPTNTSRKLAPITFTTEAATQIPNGNLDADVTNAGNNNYVFSGWGTNNAMTTSQGIDAEYCRVSLTKQTDDAHSGKAARISTQGWGSGNSAAGDISKVKYIDAGLLHLGATRQQRPDGYSDTSGPISTEDLDCGIDFTSRPSSISFWYKYEPKDESDHGVANAFVYDASGNVIASGSINLGSQSNYIDRNIELNYISGAGKAAKIYISFLSTYDSSFLTKNKLTLPTFATGTESYGSRLYIDDVTLNY